MKYLTNLAIFIFLFNSSALAQVNVSMNGSNAVEEFNIAGTKINLGQGSYLNAATVLSSDINNLTGNSTVLKANSVEIRSNTTQPLLSSQVSTEAGDESLQIYAGLNGSFIIRENIANFLFFDAKGDIIQSISNSSQSTEGESVSELASDPAQKTIVLYNPKIIMDGVEGSRARIVESNYTTDDFYYSSDRAIRNVKVTTNGQFIGVVTYGSGDDRLSLFDRYGNKLNTITFDQAIMDFEFSSNGKFVTIRSNGRIGVYDTVSGERKGSTSFRSRLHFATFVPEESTIVAMTAEKSGSILSDIEFHAINTELRSIERKEIDGQLGVNDMIPLNLERKGSYSYRITGFNNPVDLSIRF